MQRAEQLDVYAEEYLALAMERGISNAAPRRLWVFLTVGQFWQSNFVG